MKKTKAHHTSFKSPVSSSGETQRAVTPSATSPADTEDVNSLRTRLETVQAEIKCLKDQGMEQSELKEHIDQLHRYNEIKDAAQMVLGRLAALEGVRTRDLYDRYGLDLDD